MSKDKRTVEICEGRKRRNRGIKSGEPVIDEQNSFVKRLKTESTIEVTKREASKEMGLAHTIQIG